MNARERRIQQMKEKGYVDLTPKQRKENLEKSFESLKERGEEIKSNVELDANKNEENISPFLNLQGTWVGDDLEECLNEVIESRSETKF